MDLDFGKEGEKMSKHNFISKEKIPEIIIGILLVILSAVTLYPIIYVLAASLSKAEKLNIHSGLLIWPEGFSLDGYKLIMKDPKILLGYRNTIFYTILGTLINLIMTSIGAFVLSRPKLYFGKAMTLTVIFTMQFGGGMIPTYIVVSRLLGETIWTLLLPGAILTTNLMIMRTAFASVPESLLESSRIDGAGDGTILTKIILPLTKPTIAVMALYYGVSHWNSWFNASIYLRDKNLYPLQLILREMVLQNQIDQSALDIDAMEANDMSEVIKYSTIMVSLIPVLVVYPFIQKYFVKGVMIGAIKG